MFSYLFGKSQANNDEIGVAGKVSNSGSLSNERTSKAFDFMALNQGTLRRTEVVNRVVSRLLDYRVLLVRGTPSSGKTTLSYLLREKFAEDPGSFACVMVESGLPQYLKTEEETKTYLNGLTSQVEEEANKQKQIVILFDEAQTTYDNTYFWNSFVKFIHRKNIYLIMFASYGSPGRRPVNLSGVTPPNLKPEQRISMVWEGEPDPVGLLLTLKETRELLQLAAENNKVHKYTLEEDLVQLVFDLSGGHVGVVEELYSIIVKEPSIRQKRLARQHNNISKTDFEEIFMDHPTCEKLREKLYNSTSARGLVMTSDFDNSAVLKILSKIALHKGISDNTLAQEFQQDFGSSDDYEAAVKLCFTSGWIHKSLLTPKTLFAKEEFTYSFPSLIHAWHFQSLIFECSAQGLDNFSTPQALAEKLISAFQPHRLRNPPRTNIRPPEDAYVIEFYRAASEILVGDWMWSPQYGNKNEAGGGAIDFYLGAKKWGFEMLKEGNKIDTHYKRFLNGGQYARWLTSGEMVDFLVIDFRTTKPHKKHSDMGKLIHVVFKADFNEVEIYSSQLQLITSCRLFEKRFLKE